MSDWFIALGNHYWGKGKSAKAAKAAWRKAGGQKEEKPEVFQMPKGVINCWVDALGRIHWQFSEDVPEESRQTDCLKVS